MCRRNKRPDKYRHDCHTLRIQTQLKQQFLNRINVSGRQRLRHHKPVFEELLCSLKSFVGRIQQTDGKDFFFLQFFQRNTFKGGKTVLLGAEDHIIKICDPADLQKAGVKFCRAVYGNITAPLDNFSGNLGGRYDRKPKGNIRILLLKSSETRHQHQSFHCAGNAGSDRAAFSLYDIF